MRDEQASKEPQMTAAAGVVGVNPLAPLAEAVSHSREALPSVLEAARDGDAEAFAALVHRFETPTYHFILRMVRRPAIAEDLSQEVFVRLWHHLDRIEEAGLLPAWLRRVAANAVIDHWRKQDARERRMQVLREHPIARRVVRPCSRIESREAADAVRAAVEKLPAKLRSVLLLRTVEGLSYEKLADVLGLSVNAVRSRLFRARQEVLAILRRSTAAEHLAAMYAGSAADAGL